VNRRTIELTARVIEREEGGRAFPFDFEVVDPISLDIPAYLGLADNPPCPDTTGGSDFYKIALISAKDFGQSKTYRRSPLFLTLCPTCHAKEDQVCRATKKDVQRSYREGHWRHYIKSMPCGFHFRRYLAAGKEPGQYSSCPDIPCKYWRGL
jgi:hypothetical protein